MDFIKGIKKQSECYECGVDIKANDNCFLEVAYINNGPYLKIYCEKCRGTEDEN